LISKNIKEVRIVLEMLLLILDLAVQQEMFTQEGKVQIMDLKLAK
jgi:hypothetical protein